MHMRTTLNIDDGLLDHATRLSGLREKTAVVHAGLEALIARESAKRRPPSAGRTKRPGPVAVAGQPRGVTVTLVDTSIWIDPAAPPATPSGDRLKLRVS